MRINKGSLSSIILSILEKSVDGYVRFEDFASNPGLYAYYGRWEKNLPKSGFAKAIARLKAGELVEKVKVDNQMIVKLTNVGEQFLFDNNLKDDGWDEKWRIVIFDIPEQKRIIRNLFRRNLKKWGFKPLQKSVWISKRDVFEKLTRYISDLKLEPYITVIESNKILPPIMMYDRTT
ncbi:hypothetical protein HYW46_00810 [Candidatus Daviesbacteria bacterium]|nr:hypothetical protein [Candidatus Daviesbacteria bacterium]